MEDRHYIPSKLDEPEKLGLWDVDEVVLMAVILVAGIASGYTITGIGGALAAWLGLKKAKGNRAYSLMTFAGYWYLPSFKKMSSTPPSSTRLMGG